MIQDLVVDCNDLFKFIKQMKGFEKLTDVMKNPDDSSSSDENYQPGNNSFYYSSSCFDDPQFQSTFCRDCGNYTWVYSASSKNPVAKSAMCMCVHSVCRKYHMIKFSSSLMLLSNSETFS